MKKVILCIAVVVITATSVCLYSCNSASAVDVVEGVVPVQSDSWRTELVRRLQIAGNDEERVAILNSETNRLTNVLIAFLRSSNYDCRIDTIEYRYGSGKADSVAGGDKRSDHHGVFTNQPYAVVRGGECFRDSMYVFIRCFNGTFALDAPGAAAIGGGSPRFTVEYPMGINYYVDFPTTLFIADRFGIQLYEGKGWNKKATIERARHLYETDSLKWIGIKAQVSPGDHFDLGNMTYTHAGQVRHATP